MQKKIVRKDLGQRVNFMKLCKNASGGAKHVVGRGEGGGWCQKDKDTLQGFTVRAHKGKGGISPVKLTPTNLTKTAGD